MWKVKANLYYMSFNRIITNLVCTSRKNKSILVISLLLQAAGYLHTINITLRI